MKRHFMMGLKALCTGVMTLCVASLSFTSCYDDSALNAEVDELGDKVTALDARLQAVEALTAKLEALTARVDALYTLKFQVTATNELQYSFDGGTTWVNTGIKLAKELECTCEPAQPCTCVDVTLVDNGDSVTITVGEQSFTIEKPEEIVFEIRAGKVYFESEGTMTVGIKSSGIEDVTVMAAPKGWFAEINSEGLVEITAPNYEDTQEGYGWDENDEYYEIPAKCAASGFVKVHACGANGKCMVGKIPVEVAGQPLIVKAYNGTAYFTLAGEASWWNATFYYGVSEKANLVADTADLLKRMNDGDWSLGDDYPTNYGELTEVEVSIAELLGEEPQVGKEYVVWAAVENSEAMPYDVEDLVIVYYSPVKVDITEDASKRTSFNVDITVNVQGVDSYVAVAMPESQLQYTSVDEIKEQMVMAMAEGMYYGKLYTESYTGSLLDIAAGTSYSMTGNYSPDSDVYVFILPVDGRSKEDYTPADVVCAQFATAPLATGGSIDLNAKQVTSYMGEVYDYEVMDYVPQEIVLNPYTQLGVEVNPSTNADWVAFYYSWVDDDTYNESCAVDGGVAYLLENAYPNGPAEIKSWPNYIVEEVTPATKMHFIGFIVDKAGKYGKVAHIEATSQELAKADLEWDDAKIVTNLEKGTLKNSTTLKFTPAFVDGNEAASFKYVLAQTKYYNQYEGMDDAQMAEELFFSTSSSVKTVSAEELLNGVLYVDGHKYGYPYYFAIVALDETGAPAECAYILEYEAVFELSEAFTEGEAFEATKPQITLNLPPVEEFYPDGGWGDAAYYGYEDQTEWGYGYHYYYEIGFAVTPVDGTEVKAQYVDTQSYDLEETAAAKAGQLWSESLGFGCLTTSEPAESSYKYLSHYQDEPAPAVVLCVSWKDAEGNIYYMDVDVQPELQKLADRMTMMINGGATDEPSEEPAALTIEGKQWIFTWDAMGVPAMLDFGVAAENYFYLAYDASAYGMDGYVEYIGSEYTVTPTDETSGVITLVTYNMYGEPITMDLAYSDLTETSCKFINTDIQLSDLEGNPIVATVSEEVLPVTPNGVAM